MAFQLTSDVLTRGFEHAMARRREWGRLLGLYCVEMAVVLAFMVVYYLGRGTAPLRPETATANALTIIDIERALGVFHERAWQDAIIGSERTVDLANFIYVQMHMPFLVVMGFVLFARDARKHRVLRNAILLSAFIAVPIYHLVPVTPPRLLAEHGYPALSLVDTLPSDERTKPASLENWYAAIPSYHYGWNFLLVIGVFWAWRNVLVRSLAVLFSAVMWWAIVVTGNHFFFDMVLGAAMMVPCLLAALWFERWADRNPDVLERFTVRAGPLRIPF